MIHLGALTVDPVANPAVLATGTWDPEAAKAALARQRLAYWRELERAANAGESLPEAQGVTAYAGSTARRGGRTWLLLRLADGQRVLAALGKAEPGIAPALAAIGGTAFFPTDAAVLDRYCRLIDPPSGPRALGSTPRLGIGCRMSTAVWPGVWEAMNAHGFAANAIQNSLRELSLLGELTAGVPPRSNYQFSFGMVQEGHTGATFEGLWTEGVLSAIAAEGVPRYGADADHIMVKRTSDGLERAKRIIEAGRHYSFFTLDVSDILDYAAVTAAGAEALETTFTNPVERRQFVLAHRGTRRVGGIDYSPTEADLARLAGKYGRALEAADELAAHLSALKAGVPFDLELSVDENPPEIETCGCLTTLQELAFLLLEARRRALPLTHVAPNFGVEKGTDYRCPDGLVGLQPRAAALYRLAESFGVMLDCHSGDDLGRETRRTLGRASRGRIHFKISPSLQTLFGEVLSEAAPEAFAFWWDDAVAYARREAEAGSRLAASALAQSGAPGPHAPVFHHFAFATVGRRDEHNSLINRHRFYRLPAEVYALYTERLAGHLAEVADDVFCGL